MNNYLGIVSYLGTDYHGFQRQKSLKTIQGTLEKTLSELLGEKTVLKGAGRTDAGVHAFGQAFSFKSDEPISDQKKFLRAANRLLPADIALVSLRTVPPSFDARHSCVGKVYIYRFSWGPRNALESRTVCQLGRDDFDISACEAALERFKGLHDFRNFTTKKADKDGFARDLSAIEVTLAPEGKSASVRFLGNGFMTYMVRLIMGTALRAGFHKIKPEDVTALLERKPRSIVSYKASPEGLYLKEVLYAKIP